MIIQTSESSPENHWLNFMWCLVSEVDVNNLFMVKCMVFMHRWCCRDHANYYMSKLQFDKYALLSQKGFCSEYALLSQNGFRCKYAPFWVCFVQTFTQIFRIWLRFWADIWTKNQRLTALNSDCAPNVIRNIENWLQFLHVQVYSMQQQGQVALCIE